jgi:aspartyl protease family protein
MRFTLGLAVALAGTGAGATTVEVISLAPGKVEFVANGSAVRALRAGQVSPEGVRLVGATASQATLEFDGERHVLGLGESNRAVVAITADARGQFFTTVHINGRSTTAIVDTGATALALGAAEAARLGVSYAGAQRVRMYTANGETWGYRVQLPVVRLGAIAVSNVEAVIQAGPHPLRETLLGMSFLNQVEMRRSGNTLTLSRRR